MAAFVRRRGVEANRIVTSSNWSPAGLSPQSGDAAAALRKAWGLDGKFVVAYSGNLGRVHALVPLIHLARQFKESPDFVFLFIGGGAQQRALEHLTAQLQLTHVQFRPPQPRAQLAETLAVADVHCVTLREDCASFVFPSKLYGIAAVGRPVLFVGPTESEVARLVTTRGFGLAFRPNDLTGLTEGLRALRHDHRRAQTMAQAAVDFSRRSGQLGQAAATWTDLLNRLKPLAVETPARHNPPHAHDDRS